MEEDTWSRHSRDRQEEQRKFDDDPSPGPELVVVHQKACEMGYYTIRWFEILEVVQLLVVRPREHGRAFGAAASGEEDPRTITNKSRL